MREPHATAHKIISDLGDKLRIPILTLRYEVLMYLAGSDWISTDEFLEIFRGSKSRFHQMTGELQDAGLITIDRVPDDGRARTYRLTDGARPKLIALFSDMPEWLEERLVRNIRRAGRMTGVARRIKTSIGVILPTPPYEILLNLFDAPDQSVSDLCESSLYAATTFYQALADVRDKGLVTVRPDEEDRRRSRYSLSDWAERQMAFSLGKVLDNILRDHRGPS